jgi:2-oxo-4-hydroxy-4-carboxy-5-ureidoimidazoline decarboxylase
MSNTILENWNLLSHEDATQTILPCNGSRAWAEQLAALRPFATAYDLTCTADIIWRALNESDWQQAFDSHPRIGQRKAKAATAESLKWSAGEQAAANPDDQVKAALTAANQAYEQKFGRIFIVCATGKTAAEMLAILNQRMANNPAAELRETAEQQRQITQLRLRKWLGIAI